MKTRLFAIALAAWSATSVQAAPPLGTFIYDFNATNTPLWDLSGPLELNHQIIGALGSGIPLQIPIVVDQSVKGRLEGSGFISFLADTNPVTGQYRASGKIFTASNRTKVKLNVRITGRDVIAGVTNSFRITLVYQLELDPVTARLHGTVRGTAKFSQLIGGRVHESTEIALPAGNDGSWVLQVELSSATPPGGTATITLPNGRFLQYSARGSHSESRDRTKLVLRGFGSSQSTRLTLHLWTTNALLTDITGRIMGQKLNEPVRPAPPKQGDPAIQLQ